MRSLSPREISFPRGTSSDNSREQVNFPRNHLADLLDHVPRGTITLPAGNRFPAGRVIEIGIEGNQMRETNYNSVVYSSENEKRPVLMSIQQEISDYLRECGVFYFGTVADGAPVIRPLGFQMCINDRLYLGVGTFKNVYQQLIANPNVYICATKPDGANWIRVSGTAVCDDDPALVEAVWELSPQLKPTYDDNGWEMGVFHLENAKATWMENFMVPARTEEF